MIVGSGPLALDLEAGLWGAGSVAEVSAWQGIVALFGEDGHVDGCLLEGGCVGVAIGEAAGEFVDGLFYGIERHVKLLALDAGGDEDLHADFAVGRSELDVAAAGDAAFGGQLGGDFDEAVGCDGLYAFGAEGHAALLEVLEEAAVVEVEIISGAALFAGFEVLDGEEARLAIGERKFLGEEER